LFLPNERLDALSATRSREADVLSLYLPIDPAGAYPHALERLIREASATSPALRELRGDLDLLIQFVRDRFVPGSRRGLCAFSSARKGLFEAFALPSSFTPFLSAGVRPQVSALVAASAQYRRFLVLLVNGSRARLVEIHGGEWQELESWDGVFSQDALVRMAQRAEVWRRGRGADLFILGALPAMQSRLEPLLSAELRAGLIVEPLLTPDRPIEAVVERVAHNERGARRVRESVLIERFLSELSLGSAVSGLAASLAALQRGGARLLLVREGYAKMGRCCPTCGRLSVDHRSCPWCFRTTEPITDLVAELSERASAAGIEVFRVGDDARFDAAGRIGVCVGAAAESPRREIPEARALRVLFATKGPHSPRPRRP
jgi:hypothetical protein